MHITLRTVSVRAQAVICALAVMIGLTVAPALIGTAEAAPARSSLSACASAQAVLAQAQHKHAVAKQKAVKAKKALAKAKKAKVSKAAKVKKATKALAAAKRHYRASTNAVKIRQAQARSACATATPNPAAVNTGKKISLLGIGNGLELGDLELTQLTALLEQLLPGVTGNLNPAQLVGLLGGFNAGPDLDPAAVLGLLTGVLSPTDITALLAGDASPEVLTGLIEDVVGQLSGLAGGLPIPAGFDPAGLWDTFAGIFGTLSADQLGSLLAMVTSALGLAGDDLDLDQLTDLIDSLVPGISDQFSADQLIAMLAGLNGGGLSAEALANLLGGQFSPEQLLSVLGGTASQALLGSVIAQVMAQLGTAGGGGLELPDALGSEAIAGLISTVTNLITSILSGGGVLPVVCGLIPIPFLCP